MNATQTPEIQVALREVMASVATPVAIVTAAADSTPFGTTVSAFMSLSMTPPMVLVSLAKTSDTLDVITRTHTFGINVLGVDQSSTALNFARKGGPEKFVGTHWTLDGGVPHLHGSTGWITSRVSNLVDGGDHILVMGDVITAELFDGGPLTYHRRKFGTHAPHCGDTV